MSERPWSKDWRAGWRDERLDDCGAAAVALRPCLVAHVVDVDEDGTGWVMNLDGRPMSVAQLGRLVRHDEAAALAGLEQLAAVKIAVRREDGCWGILGWQKTQESAEAARVRKHRAQRVTPAVTPAAAAPVTATVTVTDRGGEEERREEQNSTPSPSAGGREEIPPSTRTTTAPPATLGQRLALARESAATPLSASSVARLARIHRTRYDQLEADEALPEPDELRRIATTLARPDIAAWELPERDLELVAAVVRQHRDLAVELGAMDPGELVVTPADVAVVYATEPRDTAQGLSLAAAWRRAIARGAEDLRRDIARGKPDQRLWFTLAALAGGKRRAHLLAALDLDRRDDPTARAPPRGRRGPAPPQNHDRLTDGEIPT